MSRLLHVVTHPEVQVEPVVPVPEWALSNDGLRRAQGLLALSWVRQVAHVFGSAERKAVQTAELLAVACGGLRLVVDEALGENDRSATGFLPPAEFEAVADLFFREPTQRVRGWESAQAAQQRVVTAVDRCLARATTGDVALVNTKDADSAAVIVEPVCSPWCSRRRSTTELSASDLSCSVIAKLCQTFDEPPVTAAEVEDPGTRGNPTRHDSVEGSPPPVVSHRPDGSGPGRATWLPVVPQRWHSVRRADRIPIGLRDETFENYRCCHGSMRLTSVCRKSLRLRVARAASWARQMEAICASNPSIDSPIWSRPRTTSA